MTQDSRRSFLTAGASVGAAALLGGTQAIGQPIGQPFGKRIVPGSPYPTFSRAVVFDRLIFVSGVLGQRPGTREMVSPDFAPQAKQVLENLKDSVEAAGSRLEQVLKCTCFLTDPADFPQFNEIYTQYFPFDPPARSTVIVKALVVPVARVEVECVACL